MLKYNFDYKCKTATTDLTDRELKLITETIYQNGFKNYLEVGVWHGATLYHVLNILKHNNHEITAVGYDCFNDGAEGDTSHTSGWPDINRVRNSLSEFENVSLVVGDAKDIDKVITDQKFDFVFHDANHVEDAIIRDLIALKEILNEGAYVAVHNSNKDIPSRKFFGKSAIDKLVADGHYVKIQVADSSTLLMNADA
jgi:cephalosporin hydroxylase